MKPNSCIDCGKSIGPTATRCPACMAVSRQTGKGVRKYPANKEWLEEVESVSEEGRKAMMRLEHAHHAGAAEDPELQRLADLELEAAIAKMNVARPKGHRNKAFRGC